jgi:hypothetical protein
MAAEEHAKTEGYCPGVLLALCTTGAQDVYVRSSTICNDVRTKYLRGHHNVSYQKLDVTPQVEVPQSGRYRFTIKRTCDVVNRVDLVIRHRSSSSINSLLKKVTVECGGQRIDALGGVNMDIHTHIETNCVLLSSGGGKKQRRIAHVNGRTFIPLVMAPFYEHNMAALIALQNHEVCVLVEVASAAGVCIEDVELWGNVYFLDTPERRYLVNNAHEFMTMQNQYLGPKTMRAGENRFPLNFNHPAGMVYFWGFDKTKVTNLKLMLNHITYYDGDIEPLEYFKACQGYGDAEPCMIIFSQSSFGEPTLSTVNFSRLDNAELVITTTQTEESTVYIVGLSMQPVRMMSGMLGLAFSK